MTAPPPDSLPPGTPSMADAMAGEGSSPYNHWIGYRLVEWAPDMARFELDLRPEHLNRTGVAHGGVMMAMLDVACSFAGLYPVGGVKRWCVTLTLGTQFIGSTSAGRLIATGRRRGGGKTIFFAAGEVRDEAGALLAAADASYRYRSAPAP